MRKLVFYAVLIVLGFTVTCPAQGQKNKLIPVTTKSEKALALYNKAMVASGDVDMQKFLELANQSLAEDPDFFMANYQMAMYYLYYPSGKKFEEYSTLAVGTKAKLSKGELLLKEALVKLRENPEADVTAFGKKLVELYPKDANSYTFLTFYQLQKKDNSGAVESLNKAIGLADNPAPYYNMLGYTYMYLGQFDNARIALDKYIELQPDNPNVYDSKGDYFMNVKDYRNAYETFMKAYALNPGWGFSKAMYAKTLADSPLGDTETIAEMKAIRETIEGEIQASFAGEYEKWTGYFVHEPYVVWMQSSKDKYWIWKGWKTISASMKEVVKPERAGSIILEGITNYMVRIYKDAAYVTFNCKSRLTKGSGEVPVLGAEARSLEKKDGKWKITYLGSIYRSTWDQ